MTEKVNVIDRLKNLGFSTASNKIKRLAIKKRKLAIAYEHYRFVRQDKIDKFNDELKEKTFESELGISKSEAKKYGYGKWKTLDFTLVEDYKEVPPEEVLSSLEIAISRDCFDYFEVAHIVSIKKLPDPILFGRMNGCSDRFFIAQWDNDVSIEQILKSNEG